MQKYWPWKWVCVSFSRLEILKEVLLPVLSLDSTGLQKNESNQYLALSGDAISNPLSLSCYIIIN